MIIFCGYSHILVNFTIYAAVRYIIEFEQPRFFLVVWFWIWLGSIWADIDHPRSTINKYLIMPFYKAFEGKRTLPHSIVGAMLFAFPVYLYSNVIGMIFFCSYIGHLLMDYTTEMGIMWFYPFDIEYKSLGWCNQKNANELIFVVACFVLLVPLGLWKYLFI